MNFLSRHFTFGRAKAIVFLAVTCALLALFFGPSRKAQKKVAPTANLPPFLTSANSNGHIFLNRPAVAIRPVPIRPSITPPRQEPPSQERPQVIAKESVVTSKKVPITSAHFEVPVIPTNQHLVIFSYHGDLPEVKTLPEATNKSLMVYTRHFDVPPETNAPSPGPKAPFGRLLQCQLVNTLESLTPNTPIIGLVVGDLWFGGKLVVPAGSEVHGQAQLDRVRERITSMGTWHIVMQTGDQVAVSGIALDREFDSVSSGWGITDGSAGIRGNILRSGTLDEVKLFLATALSGLAAGLQQTQTTPFGTITTPATIENAALAGSSQVMNMYAQRILEAIKRDGIYVRVPAGKQFYVYVTEPLDRGGKTGLETQKSSPTQPAAAQTNRLPSKPS